MDFEAWALPGEISLPHSVREIPEADGFSPLTALEVTPELLGRVMAALRVTQREGLSRLGVERVVDAVDRVARRFLDPGDELRSRALEALGPSSGFSSPMARLVLDGMARDWLRPRLESLLRAEFPDPGVLDGFRSREGVGRVRAAGYPLTFHLGAGTVPGVGATSLIRALLVKSAVLLKPGRGDVVLPVLLAKGLVEADPMVGRALSVLYWPSDQEGNTEAALGKADLVVAYGGDDTMAWVRSRTPLPTPLRAYRHRMGVGLIGREALGSNALPLEVARSLALFDQRGCVSPHLILVEEGGQGSPETFAIRVAEAMRTLEGELPSGEVTVDGGAALQQVRGEAEVAEAQGDGFVLHGGSDAPWTVLFQPRGRIEPSCLNRTLRVIPVPDLSVGLEMLSPWASLLQTVGVAGLGGRGEEIVEGLVALGVSRISSFEGVPWPPPWWHHDGDGPLRTLVRWTDLESGPGRADLD